MIAKHAYIFTRVTATQNLVQNQMKSTRRLGHDPATGYGEVTARLRRGWRPVDVRSPVRRPPTARTTHFPCASSARFGA